MGLKVLASKEQFLLVFCVVFADNGPIDHIKEGVDVIRASILVLEVVCMLPNIQSHDGLIAAAYAWHCGIVLVGSAANGQGATFCYTKPCPSRSKSCTCGFSKSILECIKVTKGTLDGISQLTFWLAASIGAHHGPEKAVIEVTTCIVSHGGNIHVIGQQVLQGLAFHFRACNGIVQVVDIAIVVL